MEQKSFAVILAKENQTLFARLKEASLPQEFLSKFSGAFSVVVNNNAQHIPPQIPVRVIEHEGNAGVLPTPAKKIIAKSVLAGEPTPALKVYEEYEPAGKEERRVRKATLHLITEVNPLSVADTTEIRTAVNTLRAAGNIVTRGEGLWEWQDPNIPSIRIEEIDAIIHLITRNAVGQYGLWEKLITTQEDVEETIAEYEQALLDTLYFDPEKIADEDNVAHEVISNAIEQTILQDDTDTLTIPVLFCRKKYSQEVVKGNPYAPSITPPRGGKGIDILIYVSTGKMPAIGGFNEHTNELVAQEIT